MTGDLAVWLRAQLDADEQTARAADEDGRWAVNVGEYETEVLVGLRPNLPVPPDPLSGMWGQVCCWHHDEMAQCGLRPSDILPTAEHIARHDPAFTLADITAKRAIVRRLAPPPGEYTAWDQERHLGEPPWNPHDPALITWEKAHGHDVRLKCYPEFGCQFAGDEDVQDLALDVLCLLAQPYAGRPGWHNEWTTT